MMLRILHSPRLRRWQFAAAAATLAVAAGAFGISQAPSASAQGYPYNYGGYGGYTTSNTAGYANFGFPFASQIANAEEAGFSPNGYALGSAIENGINNGSYSLYPSSSYSAYTPHIPLSDFVSGTSGSTYSSAYAPSMTYGGTVSSFGYLDTSGSYCGLNEDRIWVPSGASSSSYGCTS